MAKSKSLKQRKFSGNHLVLTALIFGLVGGLVGWAAFAAPHNGNGGGGKGGSGSLSLVMVTDGNSNGLPDFGDVITFAVAGSSTGQPWVSVNCYQNNTLVEQGYLSIFAGGFQPHLTLGPTQLWQSGSANCTANAYDYTSKGTPGHVFATMNFNVGA